MAKFNFTVLAGEVEQRLKELQAAGANLAPVWQLVGNSLVNRIRLGFRFSRDPWGNTWLPIKWRAPRVSGGKRTKYGQKQAAANAAASNGTGRAGQPLVDKGILRRSIVAQADATGVVVGTNLIYARVHQFGAVITPKKHPHLVFPGPAGNLIFSKRVKIPARPFLPINSAGGVSLPPTWGQNILRTLAAHFKLNQSAVA